MDRITDIHLEENSFLLLEFRRMSGKDAGEEEKS